MITTKANVVAEDYQQRRVAEQAVKEHRRGRQPDCDDGGSARDERPDHAGDRVCASSASRLRLVIANSS